jgi:anion-transporting  ArsA/GET3 family ATPase
MAYDGQVGAHGFADPGKIGCHERCPADRLGPFALSAPPHAWANARLHIVTGKGGTGKTTVAAALALGLAARGRRVLLCEVEGRQGIASVFDVAPLPYLERKIAIGADGGELWALAIDAEAALLEYLSMFYRLGRAGKALDRFGVIDFATTVAPGVRDVLLIGKVYEAARRRPDAHAASRSASGRSAYDAVVLDAPPTGRIGRFLNVNSELVGIAKVGPIRNQAAAIMQLLKSGRSKVHVVTSLEEMPVQETLDVVDEMHTIGIPIGAIVVNRLRAPALPADGLAAAATGTLDGDRISASLTKAGVTVSDRLLTALRDDAAAHAERVRLEAEQHARLDESGVPLLTLPYLSDGVDLGALYDFADVLRAAREEHDGTA